MVREILVLRLNPELSSSLSTATMMTDTDTASVQTLAMSVSVELRRSSNDVSQIPYSPNEGVLAG